VSTQVLFKPFEHAKLPLRNRVVMPPMTRGFSPNGVPGDNVVDYYRRRAEGGVGLIISEGTVINHPAAADNVNYPHFYGEAALAGWRKVIDAVHGAGAKMVPQLWHLGAMRKPETGLHPEAPSAAPSGLIKPDKKKLPELSLDEIEKLINAYADSAMYAQELGFDGIELHGAHGYLIDNFFWEGTNQRAEKYGGSIEKRTRFAVEIIEQVRQRCGEDFPIILRFSQWKQVDFTAKLAHTPEELQRFLQPLSDAGVDIFHCSNRRFWEPEFEGSDLNLAGWTKELIGKPTMSVGSVSLNEEFVATYRDGGHAEAVGIDELIRRMEANEFDLIAVGRAQIANPDWTNLIQEHQEASLKAFDREILSRLD
jgi:2,4-dienoyl-CoA reductase-like NADH-dependent reductase (Old Yellow Enzyme family)